MIECGGKNATDVRNFLSRNMPLGISVNSAPEGEIVTDCTSAGTSSFWFSSWYVKCFDMVVKKKF